MVTLFSPSPRAPLVSSSQCHPITACRVSDDKRWIVTADSGTESLIIVWEVETHRPVKVIPSPFPTGVAALDLSSDGGHIALLSHNYPEQRIAVLDWLNSKKPSVTGIINAGEFQHSIRFNPVDARDMVTTSLTKVIFWNRSHGKLTAQQPQNKQARRVSQSKLGIFTDSVFIPYTTKTVTATSTGYLVLWDYPISELLQSR